VYSVVIHVDALRREFRADWLLAQRLRSEGYHIIFTSRMSTNDILKFYKPDFLILTHAFTLSQSELTAIKNSGTKIFVNEIEGVIDNELGVKTTYPDDIDYSVFSGIFVWNQWTRNWLYEHRKIGKNKVYVTGSIRNNCLSKKKQEPAHNGERTIGVLSRFEFINVFDNRHNFVNLLSIDYGTELYTSCIDRFNADMEAFCIITKITEGLVNLGNSVLIRPHPNENLESYRLIKEKYGDLLKVDDSLSIVEFLEKTDVVLSPVSTAYTEAYLLGIPVVSTDGIHKDHAETKTYSERVLGTMTKIAYKPKSIDEAVIMCNNAELAPIKSKEIDEFLNTYYSLNDNPDPIQKIVEIINSAQKESGHSKIFIYHYFGSFVKVLIDIKVLLRAILCRNPLKSINQVRQYHYNSLLHSQMNK